MRRLLLALLLAAPAAAPAQRLASAGGDGAATAGTASRTTALAVRAPTAPIIDGREDDAIWAQAQVIDGFRMFEPVPDGDPKFRTVAKIAYDDRYIYVLVRAYDPHPDSIIGLLSRRDKRTQSDHIKVMIDSYHDRRTGYEFAVNPRGVKRDYYTYNDSEEDESWDGVWDVATSIDSLGWVAEFRIPFSQLRFPKADEHTFGIMIWREIARTNERDSWPVFRRDKPGIASQFGELDGVTGIGSPRRLEILPYVVTKSTTDSGAAGYGRSQQLTGGADIKYGVTSNLTLDATVNPDFGQVDADPAVLNLSGTETFFPERRPFFVEGMGMFRFDMFCNDGQCSGLFYSRRVGRTPQIYDGITYDPQPTTILGAAKLTGRLSSGLSMGFMDAYTQRDGNINGQTIEPATNYFTAVLQQEFRGGASSIGGMFTGVNRQNDAFSGDSLRSSAYTGGINFRHEFDDRNYSISGFVAASDVFGTPAAIAVTQSSYEHYFQMPDDGVKYDTTRTSLFGDAEKLNFSKIAGGITRFNTIFTRYSPGFEPNDMGFLQRAGLQQWTNWFGLQFQQPTSWYRQFYLNFNEWQKWNAAGLDAAHVSDVGLNVNADWMLPSTWWIHAGTSANEWVHVYDDRASRGGPAVSRSPWNDAWVRLEGDQRLRFSPSFGAYVFRGSLGRSHGWGVDPAVLIRVASNFALQIAPHYDLNIDDHQWVDNIIQPAGDTSYTFAHIYQTTWWLTARMDYTVTTNFSLQIYLQPFVSAGQYGNWRTLNDPRSANYDDRYKPYVDPYGTPLSAYNFTDYEFNSNVVLRWEYHQGSTIYLVWTQGRSNFAEGSEFGEHDFSNNAQGLFNQHPANTFLIKVSYWINP